MRETRTVHAGYPGMEIVRYDRAGKWYLEPTDRGLPRQRVTLSGAVEAALWGVKNSDGFVDLGCLGGGAFDSLYRKKSA